MLFRSEPDRALDTLPELLKQPADRERLLTFLERLLTDPRVQQQQPTAEQLTMLGRIRRVLGAAGGPRLAAVSTGS